MLSKGLSVSLHDNSYISYRRQFWYFVTIFDIINVCCYQTGWNVCWMFACGGGTKVANLFKNSSHVLFILIKENNYSNMISFFRIYSDTYDGDGDKMYCITTMTQLPPIKWIERAGEKLLFLLFLLLLWKRGWLY